MKRFVAWLCALMLMVGCIGDLTPVARAAEEAAAAPRAAGSVTYYVSASGKGGNNGLSQEKPFPGLDAVPWDQLMPGDSVLLRKGDTFPGTIRVVGAHGTAAAPITIGTYGTGSSAPVIEARGQGIWLPEEGNTDSGATPGKYASAGVLLYDCSYVTVSGLEIVNRPDPLKTSYQDMAGASDVLGVSDHSGEKLPYAGVAVAADGSAAAPGIVLSNITVRGDSDVQTVMTDTSTNIDTTGVTKGAAASERTLTNAGGAYYVSSLNGSDSNDGTAPDKAFYSLHKINELRLQPGTKVYLERGSVFENQYLHINGGGADGNPAIIDSYGLGDAPVINTNGNGVWYQNFRRNLDNANHLRQGYVSSSILIYDVEFIEIRNIAMTNFGRYGETPGADFENLGSYDGGTVPGETGYNGTGQAGEGNKLGCYQWGGKMSRTGVAGVSQNVGTMDHIYLQNLDIENVYGNIMYKHMDNGGIYFTVAYALDEATTGIPNINDLRIEGCYLKRVSRWGIAAAYTGAYSGMFAGAAISDETCQKYGATNVYIGHNYLEEVGGDPITLMYAYEPLVEYNVALNGGREMSGITGRACYMNSDVFRGNTGSVSAGIWPWKCKTALFEHNECYSMMYARINGGIGNNDCQAWDADYGDSTIYQYNYSSGNTGGCIMFCYTEAYNTVFRYNISYKDGMVGNDRGVLDMSANANGQIMNNTFILAENTRVHRSGHSGPAQVENNIFFNLGNAYDPSWTANSGLTYNTNIYSGFSGSPSTDSHAITVEKNALFADATFAGAPEAPKSTDKAGERTVNGIRDWTHDWATEFDMFKLKDTANAAVNAGVPYSYTGLTQDSDFGVPRVDNDRDFYGTELDEVHDIGAHDTKTAGGDLPVEGGNELIASLYELRNTTELHVPFSANNPMTVENFIKGLTVSQGATVKVLSGTAEQADNANIAADMTVKIVAADNTENSTVYTIKNKNSYNHKTDFVQKQQGNVWFHQTRLRSTGDLISLPNFAGGATGWWTGGNYTCAEYNGAGDDDTASRTYDGTGFVFRVPATGTVTISFPEMPRFRYASRAYGNSFDTDVIIYRNGVQIGDKYRVPKPTTQPTTTDQPGTAVTIGSFDLTVAQGDTIEFMVVNSGTFTSAHHANSGDVLFNVAVAYKDEVAAAPGDTKRPTAPGGVRATDVTENSATITWTASTDNVGVDHYEVTVNDGMPTDVNALTMALAGLAANTDYTVTVKAVDDAGNKSAGSSVTFRTAKTPDTTAPTAPANGRAVTTTSTTAVIAWDASTDAVGVEGYEVTVNGETVIVRNVAQATLTGLTATTIYSVTVRAFDAAGNKSDAYSFSFTTSAADNTPPVAPTGLTVLNTTKTTAFLRWTLSADADVVGYQIQVNNGGWQNVGNVFQYTLTDLTASTEYTVNVRAVDESGNPSGLATVTFETISGSSEKELISSLYEIRDTSKIQVPFTENHPMTVERFRTGLTVSEEATVKVFDSNGRELSASDNVGDGMTVKIVAQDQSENPVTYTIVHKNTYNSYVDWVDGRQGNVWFYQHENGTEIADHTLWNSWGWGGESPAYKSVEKNQACGSVTAEQGSGYTFRAPADGMVQIRFYYYMDKNSDTHVEDQVKKRENTTANTLIPYIGIFVNGNKLDRDIMLAKDASAVTVQPMTFSVEQGDTLSFLACNGGTYTNKSGNNGVFFTPVLTYVDETHTPDPDSVTMSQTSATIYTNNVNTAELHHTVQLSAAVLPVGAAQTVVWSSSNTNVATVDQTGLVTAVSNGTAIIRATATASTGETVWGSCTVTVNTRIEGITVEKDGAAIGRTPIKLYANQGSASRPNSVTLTAVPNPANPTHPTLNWSKINDSKDIISIDSNSQNGTSATITAIGDELDVGRVTVRVASAHHSDVYTEFTVEVYRFLEHNVYIVGDARPGSTLTASIVELEMTDEAKAALQYQWYRDSVAEANKIEGAIESGYTVTTADIGHRLVVTVTADESTFYEGTRTAVTDTVGLAAAPAAPVVTAVNCTAGDNGRITGLDPTKNYEYRLDTAAGWTPVPEGSESIDNLPAGNYLVRISATGTTAASAAATATIMPAGVTAYSITIDSGIEHGSITPSVTQAQEGGKFTLTATPETGYKLTAGSLTVTYTDGDGTHTLEADTDGSYTMPDAHVTVTAAFEKLTFTITHSGMANVSCSLPGAHSHTVEYGDAPVITITANEGYTMPANVQVTYEDVNGNQQPFYNYVYSRSASDPDTATLRFTSGITANLTVSAVIPAKTFTVSFNLSNGLSAPVGSSNARTVAYKHGYVGQLVAESTSGYTLPLGIQINMGGEPFTEFAYSSESGMFTIGEGKITGDLTIIASGVDASVTVNPVDNLTLTPRSATVTVGETVTLTATVIGVDPSIPATNPTVIWTSSNTEIATVENGVVTGVAAGTVTIRATTEDGGIFRTCQVTVTEVSIDPGPGDDEYVPTITPPAPTDPDDSKTDDTKTEVKENEDGTTTTIVTDNKTGTVTETTEKEDGTVEVVETKKDGTVTETTTDPEGGKVEKITTPEEDVTITVTDAEGEVLAKVELPAEIPAVETRFVDVPVDHWADKAIHSMAALEVVNGVGNDRFDMNGGMTRGALATVLSRLSHGQEGLESGFADVDSGKWYADGIAWAAKTGVVTGYSATEFGPDDIITREQLAVMLCRYARLLGMDTTADSAALDDFTDGSTTHSWATDSIAWCVENGILNGMGNGTLAPTATATRAQVAMMLQRFIDLMK